MAKMNQSEYARHREVSHTAVQKAIKSGRISAAVGKDKKIDQKLADQLWDQNTDQTKPLNSITGSPKHRRTPNTPKAPIGSSSGSSEPASNSDNGNGPSYVQARAVREAYEAKLKRLEYESKSGKLIELSAAEVAVFNQARKARDMLFSIPDRISALLAATDDSDKVYEILTKELRKVADDIAHVRLS